MPRGSSHAQTTTKDLYLLKAFKENIQIAAEEESGGEGSTPEVSTEEELQEEESMDEDVAGECNSDMPLGTYLKKKNKKKT
ncbi:hypothetical protein LR48_Vigan11g113700 [Vigna angularis]|uniref:Uncharacterized protein n=1 Tax=Phaseolus angularis TaxID=3914 RepID=A0A0L9VT34_PHAAN|nr:hypothetical protein LR48_Vigan11g113700 [Vigna angularis]